MAMGLRSSALWTTIRRRCATASFRWIPFPSALRAPAGDDAYTNTGTASCTPTSNTRL